MPALIAVGRGYFEEQGLEIELVGGHGDHNMELLGDGHLDAAAMRPSLYFYRAWNSARPMAMVADGGRSIAGKGGGAIVARPALVADGSLRDYPDLRGRRIGLSPDKGDHDWLTIAAALRKGRLTWDDVEVIECDYGDGRHEAVAKGTIDVTTVSNAKSVIQGRDAGAFVPWKYENEVEEGRQAAALMYGPTLRERPQDAMRFMVAYLRGVRDYCDAFQYGRNRDAVLAGVSSVAGLSPDVVARDMVELRLDPDGDLNLESIKADVDWMNEAGALPNPVPLDGVVDNSYREAALRQLGPHAEAKA
jgi:NitT/TauT family transport system substrate-binding protein